MFQIVLRFARTPGTWPALALAPKARCTLHPAPCALHPAPLARLHMAGGLRSGLGAALPDILICRPIFRFADRYSDLPTDRPKRKLSYSSCLTFKHFRINSGIAVDNSSTLTIYLGDKQREKKMKHTKAAAIYAKRAITAAERSQQASRNGYTEATVKYAAEARKAARYAEHAAAIAVTENELPIGAATIEADTATIYANAATVAIIAATVYARRSAEANAG